MYWGLHVWGAMSCWIDMHFRERLNRGSMAPMLCWNPEIDSSRQHMCGHLEGCISALLHAFSVQSSRPKAEPGGPGVHRGSPWPKACFCPVHWPWAQVAGAVPVALQARPELPGGGVTKTVGNAAALLLPAVSTVSSGEQPPAYSVVTVMMVAALHSS